MDIPLEELNTFVAYFFIKVRKLNGGEFEPGTLISFQRSFDRYLRQHGENYNIIQDKRGVGVKTKATKADR